MAQSGYTPLSLYYSSTATNVPTAGNLANGELALNITDGKLFYKDNLGVVQTLATKTFVSTVTGTSPVVSSGGVTPAISLAAAYGDTLNPYASKTANYVLAAPNGSAGIPSFRALVAADIASGTFAVANGGTGLSTTPANGQIDIGNGTGFTRTTLTAGTNITITNSAGSISIAAASANPAGSTTQVQYNNSGVFAGSANMTFNGTRLTLANDARINSLTVGRGNANDPTATACGWLALNSTNSSSAFCTGIGVSALEYTTSGISNTAVGYDALRNVTTGSSNTAVGSIAAVGLNGDNNTAIGYQTLSNATASTNNTMVGAFAGYSITTGINNVCIGVSSGFDALINITTQSNTVVLGNNNVTALYCKTSTITTSDIRDKTNIRPVSLGLDFVNKIPTIAYQFKKSREDDTPSSRTYLGWSAQDVLANQGNESIVENSDPENLKMAGMDMVAVLWKSVQELSAQVVDLQSQIKTLTKP